MLKALTAIITMGAACIALAQPVQRVPITFSTGVLGIDKYSVLFRELGRACGPVVDISEYASTGDLANLKTVAAGGVDVGFVRSDIATAAMATIATSNKLRTFMVLYPVNPAVPQVKVLLVTRTFALSDPQAAKLAKLRMCITSSIADLKSAKNASTEWNLVNPAAVVASPPMYVSPVR